jgi:hypothetical protein
MAADDIGCGWWGEDARAGQKKGRRLRMADGNGDSSLSATLHPLFPFYFLAGLVRFGD